MNRIMAVVSLCISGYYACNVLRHMISPGMNVGYTRMLLFACLATIPLVFLLLMVGGKDRLLFFFTHRREMIGGGPAAILLLAGLVLVLIFLPVGMLVGIWFGMGFHFGSLFLLYFVPLIIRLIFGSTKDSILAAIIQGLTFFFSFFLGICLVAILERYFWGADTYGEHFQLLWPGYRDAAKVFFSVSIFALLNQLMEFRHALVSLFAR
ncbi:MAG TPA: hypothetical protein VGJ94_06980 [Syntrophorhabdaceae bacterium]